MKAGCSKALRSKRGHLCDRTSPHWPDCQSSLPSLPCCQCLTSTLPSSPQTKSTHIKESLVTRVLRGPHAGARREDHFHFGQINVALTAGVLTRVVVSQLETKDADRSKGPEREQGLALLTEHFPLYLPQLC